MIDGNTYWLDHTVQTINLKLRTLSPVSMETIKNLIETKYEVVDIKEIDREDCVRGCEDF